MSDTYDYDVLSRAKTRASFAYIFTWVKDRHKYLAIDPNHH